MGEYANDLMMAIVVATTALIGMTTVVCGQVAQSNKLKPSEKSKLFRYFCVSILCGVLALWLSICWFMGPNDIVLFIISPTILLTFELSLLMVPAVAFWGRSFGFGDMSTQKESPNKPVTRSKRSRK